jgi:hypothetical protein
MGMSEQGALHYLDQIQCRLQKEFEEGKRGDKGLPEPPWEPEQLLSIEFARACERSGLSPTARQVLTTLVFDCDFAEEQGGQGMVWPSHQDLARKMGLAWSNRVRRRIDRALRELEDRGILEKMDEV